LKLDLARRSLPGMSTAMPLSRDDEVARAPLAAPRTRTGVTTVVVAVTLASTFVTAAAAYGTYLSAVTTDRRVTISAEKLAAIASALREVKPVAGSHRTELPGRLSQLDLTSAGSAAGDRTACGRAVSAADHARWMRTSPLPYVAPREGLRLPIGTVDDVVTRLAWKRGRDRLRVTIRQVDEADAVRLDRVMDAGTGQDSGDVTWERATDGMTVVSVRVALNASC
jgi:hypothetical protein